MGRPELISRNCFCTITAISRSVRVSISQSNILFYLVMIDTVRCLRGD